MGLSILYSPIPGIISPVSRISWADSFRRHGESAVETGSLKMFRRSDAAMFQLLNAPVIVNELPLNLKLPAAKMPKLPHSELAILGRRFPSRRFA